MPSVLCQFLSGVCAAPLTMLVASWKRRTRSTRRAGYRSPSTALAINVKGTGLPAGPYDGLFGNDTAEY